MFNINDSPEFIRNNIVLPSGLPSRLLKEEEVKPPQHTGSPKMVKSPVQAGGAERRFAPGGSSSPPGGPVEKSAPSLSGDPGNPRPPTRNELLRLLKGCGNFLLHREQS